MSSSNIKVLKFLLCLTINLFFIGYSFAQNTEPHKKNSLYLSYGNIIFSSQVSFSYERSVYKNKHLITRVKMNFGNYLSNNLDYETNAKVYDSFLSLSAVQLIGLLELNGGVAFTKYKSAKGFDPLPGIDYSEVKKSADFYGSIGIRYVDNEILIKAGISNLELLYAGVGINF